MTRDASVSIPGAENVFARLKEINLPVESDKLSDHVDTRIVDALKKDPQLLADATKMGLPVSNVVSGAELENIINELMATPSSVVERMNQFLKQ